MQITVLVFQFPSKTRHKEHNCVITILQQNDSSRATITILSRMF
jgi:hypothetical protein